MRKKAFLILAAIVLIFIAYNLIVRIYVAVKAGERLTQAVERLNKVEIKNKELKNQLKEVASKDYIEKQARDKLGLAREGDVVMVIPEEKIKQVLGISKENAEYKRLSNWLGWIRLFFK